MQLTEHRHGLWGCVGFSRTRGQIAVQVSSKLGDWAGFTQPPAARHDQLFTEKLPFPFEVEIHFPGTVQQLALWDTLSGSQNMSDHSQHHLEEKLWLQIQVRNLHPVQDCLGLGTPPKMGRCEGGRHESCRPWSGVAAERGKFQL